MLCILSRASRGLIFRVCQSGGCNIVFIALICIYLIPDGNGQLSVFIGPCSSSSVICEFICFILFMVLSFSYLLVRVLYIISFGGYFFDKHVKLSPSRF